MIPLPAARMEEFAQKIVLRDVSRGERICGGIHPAQPLFLLVTGYAKLSLRICGRREALLTILAAGDLVGSAMIPGAAREFCCEALTEGVIGEIDPADFVKALFGTSLDEFRRGMEILFTPWLDRLVRRTGLTNFDLRQRLITVLQEMAERFGVPDSRGTLLNVPLRRVDLAAMVAASRSKVSKQLSELARDGILQRDGHRLILRKRACGNGVQDRFAAGKMRPL